MKIRALSFDFDGCLFNPNYFSRIIKGNANPHFLKVIEANQGLLDSLKKENDYYDKTTVFVGSNRQSKFIDDKNQCDVPQGKKLSCFPAIIQVANALGAELNRFLLADLYGQNASIDFEPGTSFNRAISEEQATIEHSDWVFDESKGTILYAQLHHLANAHPDDDIVFEFFDDRGTKSERDILEWLRDFYKKYPELIPANVTLRLNQYAGEAVTLIDEITGTGIIDVAYRQTVKDMAFIGTLNKVSWNSPIYSTWFVTPNQLKHRTPLKPTAEASSSSNPLPTERAPLYSPTIFTTIKAMVTDYHFGDVTRNLLWNERVSSPAKEVTPLNIADFVDISLNDH